MRSFGDMLIHSDVYPQARTAEGGYDFNHMLDGVRPYLQNADITTANMEVPVASADFGFSGYPSFNCPPQVIDALKTAGVDIVNNGTNHSMDRLAAGVKSSTANIAAAGMPYAGSFASAEDKASPRIIERNGVKVGFLSYTYGTNGIPVPADQPYLVNLIDLDVIEAEVKELKPQVDMVIVIMHAGEEYEFFPNDYQRSIVNAAMAAGATFVLGGHPHVVQPMERTPGGGGVWYSHGNFLSGQLDTANRVGGIGEFTFHKMSDGNVVLGKMRFMPTYTTNPYQGKPYGVVPLPEAGQLGLVDAADWKRQLVERMGSMSDVEVVDYLD